jgi:hypothetical protein
VWVCVGVCGYYNTMLLCVVYMHLIACFHVLPHAPMCFPVLPPASGCFHVLSVAGGRGQAWAGMCGHGLAWAGVGGREGCRQAGVGCRAFAGGMGILYKAITHGGSHLLTQFLALYQYKA